MDSSSPGLHDDGLLGEDALAQHLEVAGPGDVDNRRLVLRVLVLQTGLGVDIV